MKRSTSQAQILQSREVIFAGDQGVRLDQKPQFNREMGGVSVPSIFLSMLGLGSSALNLTIEERVLTNYFERLSVLPVDKSRVILIEFQSSDPELSARVVNARSSTPISRCRKPTSRSRRVVPADGSQSEIDKLLPKVIEAENNVQNFPRQSQSLCRQQQYQSRQPAAHRYDDAACRCACPESRPRRPLADHPRHARFRQAHRSVPTSPYSDLIKRLIEQRVTLRSQLAEQSSTLLDQHPRIKELKAQVYALDLQIRGEAEKIVHTVENDARIAGGRIETTNAAIDQLRNRFPARAARTFNCAHSSAKRKRSAISWNPISRNIAKRAPATRSTRRQPMCV